MCHQSTVLETPATGLTCSRAPASVAPAEEWTSKVLTCTCRPDLGHERNLPTCTRHIELSRFARCGLGYGKNAGARSPSPGRDGLVNRDQPKYGSASVDDKHVMIK